MIKPIRVPAAAASQLLQSCRRLPTWRPMSVQTGLQLAATQRPTPAFIHHCMSFATMPATTAAMALTRLLPAPLPARCWAGAAAGSAGVHPSPRSRVTRSMGAA